jgi:hypothetical protein
MQMTESSWITEEELKRALHILFKIILLYGMEI